MKYNFQCAVLTLLLCTFHAKIMRNNALMTKMISHFQQDNNISSEPIREIKKDRHNHEHNHETHDRKQRHDRHETIVRRKEEETQKEEKQEVTQESPKRPEKVLNLMQNVLCKNFPSIPCKIITQDAALNKLIKQSIQQIAVKKQLMEQTTMVTPRGFSPAATLFPVINSEDLSNFLEVSNTGYFNVQEAEKKVKKKKKIGDKKVKNHWSHDRPAKKKLKGTKDTKRGTELYTGRKKMRKFYPHKIKYKDKSSAGQTFREYGEDLNKMPISAEVADGGVGGLPGSKTDRLTFKVGPSDTPVWRIDYMKHGVPSLNMFEFEDERIGGTIMKPRPAPADENGIEQAAIRKEVLHPDVYIKKNNFIRQPGTNINSDILE